MDQAELKQVCAALYEAGEFPNKRWAFSRKVTLGNLLVIVAFVISAVLSWANMNARMSRVETVSTENQNVNVQQTLMLSKLDRTLDLLQQRLADYRLHKHEGSRIIYPNAVNRDRPE